MSEEGPVCSCGNRGCLETMVSASTLIRRARNGMEAGLSNTLMNMTEGDSESLSVEMIAQAAREGDRFSLRLLSETGMYLGRGIVGLVNLLNPELIVIGAAVASTAGDLLLPEIQRVVHDRAMIRGGESGPDSDVEVGSEGLGRWRHFPDCRKGAGRVVSQIHRDEKASRPPCERARIRSQTRESSFMIRPVCIFVFTFLRGIVKNWANSD